MKKVKGSSFQDQFESLSKDKQDEYKYKFGKFTYTGDYFMNLPEEIRQKILLQMDPFDIYRMSYTALNNFKVYLDTYIWPLKIKLDFPNVVYEQNLNLVWVYFTLFFSELKYVEYQRKHRFGEGMYYFVYGENIKDITQRPGIQIYWEANGDPEYEFITLHLSDRQADEMENDKIWKYFQNLTKYLKFEIEYEIYEEDNEDGTDRKLFTIYPDRTNSDMFKVFYSLFEMGFKLIDASLYEESKKEFYIRSKYGLFL